MASHRVASAIRFITLLVVLGGAGCRSAPSVRIGPAPTATELIANLRARGARIVALRTEAKVDYLAGRGERIKLTMAFLTRAPRELRIDAESPVGGTVLSFASDGDQFQLLDVRANRFLTGPATPCAVAMLLRIRLPPSDLIEVLHGGAPLIGEPVSVAWDPSDGGREVLTLRSSGGLTETVRLSSGSRDVVGAEVVDAEGRLLYRVTHEDFSEVDGVRLPRRTLIDDPLHDGDAKIRYRERGMNPAIPPGAFRLEPPPGLPVEGITCDD